MGPDYVTNHNTCRYCIFTKRNAPDSVWVHWYASLLTTTCYTMHVVHEVMTCCSHLSGVAPLCMPLVPLKHKCEQDTSIYRPVDTTNPVSITC